MKYIALIFVCLGLAGCGSANHVIADAKGFSRMCVDGVQYIQFIYGATVAYDKDGRVRTC